MRRVEKRKETRRRAGPYHFLYCGGANKGKLSYRELEDEGTGLRPGMSAEPSKEAQRRIRLKGHSETDFCVEPEGKSESRWDR